MRQKESSAPVHQFCLCWRRLVCMVCLVCMLGGQDCMDDSGNCKCNQELPPLLPPLQEQTAGLSAPTHARTDMASSDAAPQDKKKRKKRAAACNWKANPALVLQVLEQVRLLPVASPAALA